MPLHIGATEIGCHKLYLGTTPVQRVRIGTTQVWPLDCDTNIPLQIPDLGLWLDASVESSITLNGDGVSQWRDLSGNECHFSQPTALNQPDSSNRSQNGLRVLDFDGTQFLTGNAATRGLSRNLESITIFCVQQRDALIASRTLDMSTTASVSISRVNLSLLVNPNNHIAYAVRRPDTSTFGSTTFYNYDNDPVVAVGVLDFANAVGRMYRNGVLQHTNNTLQTPGRIDDSDSAAVSIGGLSTGGICMDGFIGEVIIYRRALSNNERQLVETWLLNKWLNPPSVNNGLLTVLNEQIVTIENNNLCFI